MEFKLYPKIPGPLKRYTEGEKRNQLIPGEWTSPELRALLNGEWIFTEKIDGTNIRIGWDGHEVAFGGRTNKAEIPKALNEHLVKTFTEGIMEQTFNDSEVVLYGEGCGKGIQKAGISYGEEQHFILFDVRIGHWWLQHDDVAEVAGKLGIPYAPTRLRGTIYDAINLVRAGLYSNYEVGRIAEGMVGVTATGLLSRSSHRIQVKIKSEDFYRGE
jgi:hypothetical protein